MLADGLYDLQTPRDLYKKAVRDLEELWHSPHDYLLFNVLCTLNHLRDWIWPEGHLTYEHRPREKWSRAEKFHEQLHWDENYQLVRDLCNQAKHFRTRSDSLSTDVIEGFRVGLNRAGDRIGHRYYFADGKELRQVLSDLVATYSNYFNETDECD